MSLQDVFGSDLEDSDNEDYKVSSEQAEIEDLFGGSASEDEDEKQQKHDSDSEEANEGDDLEEKEANEEKVEYCLL